MTLLVTGGAGFIGSHIVDKLIERGHRVVVVDNLSSGKKENINPEAQFYNIDVCASELSHIFREEAPEIVFHLAAQINLRKSVENPLFDAKNNILGSLNLLENAKKTGVKKIIFTSTGGAMYGDTEEIPTTEKYFPKPMSPYGIAKFSVEKYLDYYNNVLKIPSIVLRLANVYGPRQDPNGEAGVVAIFCKKLLNNEEPVINGDGEQTRDYVFVEDVAKAHILALNKEKTGIFNVGTAKETSVNEIFNILKQAGNFDVKAKYGPAKSGEQKRSCLDYSKIQEKLGWQPKVDITEGLRKTIEWFKKTNYFLEEKQE
jgi:UDP-glucose 4-epimerase